MGYDFGYVWLRGRGMMDGGVWGGGGGGWGGIIIVGGE